MKDSEDFNLSCSSISTNASLSGILRRQWNKKQSRRQLVCSLGDSMAKDHFVPRAYLRGFTAEYLGGSKGGQIVVYKPSSGASRRLSINEYVACEPEFYDNHPVDKEWSKTIEQKWPSVRQRLKDRQSDSALLDDLFWFVAAQYIRTHSFMHCIARQIAWEKAKRNPVKLRSEEGHGLILDMTDTADVMEAVSLLAFEFH